MKHLLLAGSLLLVACGTGPACRVGSCPAGQDCVYVAGAMSPACHAGCELGADAGTCASGTSCACAGTCPGCKNCVPVCQ